MTDASANTPSSTPSMKGSLIADMVGDIRKLVDDQTLSRAELERRLTRDDLALLDSQIAVSGWYDVRFYARCAELLRDALGDGDDGYLVQRGFDRGRALIEAGLYQQMEYAKRPQVGQAMSREERFRAYGSDLRLFVTLSKSLLNFTEWSIVVDPEHADRYRVVVAGADAYPDALAWATEGFVDAMAASHGMRSLWRHARIDDRIEFRMTRSL
ncbi:MAG: hypothetical protein KC560_21305 [Myxococcales bacterium]|nr:hypothetical protein [Myxococcales bacterium]